MKRLGKTRWTYVNHSILRIHIKQKGEILNSDYFIASRMLVMLSMDRSNPQET
jgi:hypothetical protein